ncbi:MAG TPA: hypothetical protein VIU12_27535 [Chryseolinea sp.]
MLRINRYKTSAYEASLRYAEELGVEIAADLLQMIIHGERTNEREIAVGGFQGIIKVQFTKDSRRYIFVGPGVTFFRFEEMRVFYSGARLAVHPQTRY